MTKQDDIESLGSEIRRLQEKTAPKTRRADTQGSGFAMQVGLELVCGVVMGAGIGLTLDRWLGTTPFLLIGCFLLGACGGMLTVYRTTMNAPDLTTDEKDEKNGS